MESAGMRTFSPKDATETVLLTWDFTLDLPAGVTLTGTPSITLAVVSGVQDSNIGTMTVGSPQLSGNQVLQLITAGISGNSYSAVAKCNASDGEVFAIGGTIAITPAWRQ